jgi:hypothetical protein
MKKTLLLLLILLAAQAFADEGAVKPEISKFEFQGVYFGDFPSNEMVCIKGLCPVGDIGVGIDKNSLAPPRYCKEKALTHFNGVRISAPEYSYFDNQMFQIFFSILCDNEAQKACVEEIIQGIDAQYGLTLVQDSTNKEFRRSNVYTALYATDGGSLVSLKVPLDKEWGSYPFVKIFDPALMDDARKSLNPEYLPNRKFHDKLRDLKQKQEQK